MKRLATVRLVALFAEDISGDYLQCLLKMARFRGATKLGEFIDNQQFHANAFQMLEQADYFIRRHLPIASFFHPDRFRREDKPPVPTLAIREALINAICHRDYQNRSGSIALAIFDDRLEIWNNGTLPAALQVDDLKRSHPSLPRNKLIAAVFYARGFIERWGTGTNKMIELCQEYGVPEPQFEEYGSGFSVTFKFKEPIGSARGGAATGALLNPRQEKILQLLRAGKPLSASEIFAQLKQPPSLRTVKADLSSLQKQGFVEQQGRGPSTLWRIKP